MYRLIVSDLDETLIRRDGTISQEDIDAVAAFEKAGGLFVCSTGRPAWSAQKTLKQLNQYRKKDHYVISFNGGAITENENNALLYFDGITFQQAQAIYSKGLQYDVCMHVYTKDCVYAYNLNADEMDYLNNRQEVTPITEKNLDFLQGQAIAKCLFEHKGYEYLRKIAEDMESITRDMAVSYSSNRYLEFNKKGINKGEGLKRLAGYLHIDLKDTIAIGDNFNDLSMIQIAGLGIGVANTPDEMKPLCSLITKASCEKNAIAETIYNYALV